MKKHKFKFLSKINQNNYDCIILSVAHNYYKKLNITKIKNLSKNKNCLIFDLKKYF